MDIVDDYGRAFRVYMNNRKLRGVDVPRQYTKKEAEEYIKCSQDPVYFAEKYIKIVHVDRGLVPFKMWDFQQDMIDNYSKNRFCITLCPRQVGKSTVVCAYILWVILFQSHKNCCILAHKASTAREILDRLKKAYENLPLWMQQGVKIWNKGDIELENDSAVIAASTSSSSIRGLTFNLVFLDEFAFVPNNTAEDFFSSTYPTIASGTTTQCIIVSTPNGMNHFYKMWTDATKKKGEKGKSNYVPIRVHWEDVPGRDEKWKEETISNTSERQFDQEMECVDEHTLVTVKDTYTNEIIEIPIGDLYMMIENEQMMNSSS